MGMDHIKQKKFFCAFVVAEEKVRMLRIWVLWDIEILIHDQGSFLYRTYLRTYLDMYLCIYIAINKEVLMYLALYTSPLWTLYTSLVLILG